MGQTDHLVVPFDKEWVERQRSTFETMKTTFNQPFISISKDGRLPGQFSGWRVGDIGAPAQGLLVSSEGGGIALDGGHLIAHRDRFLLWPFCATAAASDVLAVAGFLAPQFIRQQALHPVA